MAIRKKRSNNWDQGSQFHRPTCEECSPPQQCQFFDEFQWICTNCGLVSKETGDGHGVDWSETQSVVKRSFHDPDKYVLTVIKKHKVDARLTPVISDLFYSIKHAAEKTKPDDRKNLPSYPYVVRRILLRIGQKEEAAKVKPRES